MGKKFKLNASEIKYLATGHGACIASDSITVEGNPVGFMYRDQPQQPEDSGWHFFSGYETEEDQENPDFFRIYDVNTIANYDKEVIAHLEAPVGSPFERTPDGLVEVNDFEIPQEDQ